MNVIANAQADARSILLSENSTVQGHLALGQSVTQRIQFQEEKRQRNIEAVVRQAASELGDNDVPNSETDHDWTARFFNYVQDVSSEDLQSLWAKVLAGQVERTGSTSIKTLDVLKNLNKTTAKLFGKLCSPCVSIRPDGLTFIDARVPSLGSNPGGNSLQKYGLSFDALNVLNEHGLVISDYNSWYDYRISIGIQSQPGIPSIRIPFSFQSRQWVLVQSNPGAPMKEFRLSGVALTRSGQELSRIVDLEPMTEYAQALKGYFETNKLQMVEVDSWLPRMV